MNTLIKGISSHFKKVSIDKIILNGDIFDLWVSSIKTALDSGTYFFEKLSELGPKQIIYIYGNHDNYFKQFSEPSQKKAIKLRHVNLNHHQSNSNLEKLDFTLPDYFTNLCPKTKFEIWYPGYMTTLEGKSVIFMHGHHFAPDQSIYPVATRTVKIIKWLYDAFKAVRDKNWDYLMDKLMTIQQIDLSDEFQKYEDDLTDYFTAIYKIQEYTKVMGKIAFFLDKRKLLKIENTPNINLTLIDTMLDRFFGETIPYLIYGHTHRPEIIHRENREIPRTLINSGSMVGNPDIDNDDLIEFGSFISISEKNIGIYQIDFRHETKLQLFEQISFK